MPSDVRRRQSDRVTILAHVYSPTWPKRGADPLDGRCRAILVLADEAWDERVHRKALIAYERSADQAFRRVQGPSRGRDGR